MTSRSKGDLLVLFILLTVLVAPFIPLILHLFGAKRY
jgi:hypothetical protein